MARLSPPTAEWAVDGPIWQVSADRLVRSRRGSVGRRSGHAGTALDRALPQSGHLLRPEGRSLSVDSVLTA